MDRGLENMGLWIPVAHVSWPELLYGSPTSPSCFRVLDVLDSCGIWLVAFLCACFVLMVIAFLIAWSLMSRLWDLMVYLTPFLVSWDEFVNMLIELLCWFTILFLWCIFWFFLCWSLESLSPFCSNDHTCSFRWAYISRHAFYGDLMTSFMNRILHHANPHDKLSVLCVSKSWVPKYSLTNHLRFKTWTSLSLSLSCHMQDGGVGMEGMSFDDLSFCLEWLRYGWFSICLFMAFDSSCCIATSSLLCELSHTLSPYACLKYEIALVLTWSRSMYYNCSILYLTSCTA
jgi:hypothetical protein